MSIEYEPTDEGLRWQHPLSEGLTLVMSAADIRKERTGVHALVDIEMKGASLAWGTVNVEKDEERVRMANSAWGRINGQLAVLKEDEIFDKSEMKRCFDAFCRGLWTATVGAALPVQMEGAVEPRPQSFILRPYVLEGGGTILFGHPGRGKSYITLLMAVSIDAGSDRIWRCQQRPVLWINLERSVQSVAARLGNINQALGLPRDRKLLTLNGRGRSLMDVLPACKRAVAEYGVGFVLLDSISRAGMGDLTENQPVNRVIDAMNSLGPTWMGIAHAPRASDEHLYGSIHFEAGADVVVQLRSQQEEDGPLGIGLQMMKQNDTSKHPLEILALDFGATGLKSVRKASKGEFPDVEKGRKITMKQAVIDYLLEQGAATATAIALTLGYDRSNVSGLLSSNPAFVVVKKVGRDVFYGVAATG